LNGEYFSALSLIHVIVVLPQITAETSAYAS
jgi:hypothetical protein